MQVAALTADMAKISARIVAQLPHISGCTSSTNAILTFSLCKRNKDALSCLSLRATSMRSSLISGYASATVAARPRQPRARVAWQIMLWPTQEYTIPPHPHLAPIDLPAKQGGAFVRRHRLPAEQAPQPGARRWPGRFGTNSPCSIPAPGATLLLARRQFCCYTCSTIPL